MPKRKRKKYSRPKNPYNSLRIKEEKDLVKKYGLKNKKEIWKSDSSIRKVRNQAKKLITAEENEKNAFAARLKKKGFKVQDITEALALKKEDWLDRRLQTIVFRKGIASTPKQARQFIVHKLISIGGRIVNIPSYMVELEEEGKIEMNKSIKIKKNKALEEEVKDTGEIKEDGE